LLLVKEAENRAAMAVILLLAHPHPRNNILASGRGAFAAVARDRASYDIQPKHPPDQEEGDDGSHNVDHPFAGRFWLTEVEHCHAV
jgi:hypothetical protein